MNLVIASNNVDNAEQWKTAMGIGTILDVGAPDLLSAYANCSILLDRYIYLDKKQVDWVLFLNRGNDEHAIKFGKFIRMAECLLPTDDSILYTENVVSEKGISRSIVNLQGNFYCRPHVFSMLGGIYKLLDSTKNLLTESRSDQLTTVIAFAIARFGYQIRLL